MKYMCNMCNYQETLQSSLNAHKEVIHEGAEYLCNMCEYETTFKGNFKIHKESFNEGITGICVIGVTMQLHNRVILRNIKKVFMNDC